MVTVQEEFVKIQAFAAKAAAVLHKPALDHTCPAAPHLPEDGPCWHWAYLTGWTD